MQLSPSGWAFPLNEETRPKTGGQCIPVRIASLAGHAIALNIVNRLFYAPEPSFFRVPLVQRLHRSY